MPSVMDKGQFSVSHLVIIILLLLKAREWFHIAKIMSLLYWDKYIVTILYYTKNFNSLGSVDITLLL